MSLPHFNGFEIAQCHSSQNRLLLSPSKFYLALQLYHGLLRALIKVFYFETGLIVKIFSLRRPGQISHHSIILSIILSIVLSIILHISSSIHNLTCWFKLLVDRN